MVDGTPGIGPTAANVWSIARESFVPIPLSLLRDKRVTMLDVEVYAELVVASRDGIVQMSLEAIRQRFEWHSRGTASYYINRLIRFGVLERLYPGRWSRSTPGAATTYLIPPCAYLRPPPANLRGHDRAGCAGGGAQTSARSLPRITPLRGVGRPAAETGPAACQQCDGTGWVMVDPDDRQSPVEPCSCRR